MPQGLQVFDASGNIMLDLGSRMGIFLGIADVGTTDGYENNPGLQTGYPYYFWHVLPLTTTYNAIPQLTIGVSAPGGVWRINWTWVTSGSGSNMACKLVYGIY